jgi:SAM-dependent methyltransferase
MPDVSEPYLHRACPTCGGTQLDDSWKVASEPPAEDCSLTDLPASWRGFFKNQKNFFTYRRCAACGQVYSPRYFTPGQVAELYRQMDDNTGGLAEALMARTQRGYFDLLSGHAAPTSGGYLELGPDIGLFTREVMTNPAFSTYWMIEPNRAVHPILSELLADKPHTLLTDLAEIERVPDESLSLAVAIHVFDHLLEPQALLERLMRKLRPGGRVFTVTHNGDSFITHFFEHRWPAYCLQHPQIYTQATLQGALAKAGFQQTQFMPTRNYFPVMYLLRHFLFGAGLGRIPLPELSSWTMGMQLGNMAAIGQKP